MPTLLFTGFPGFLGRELLPRLLERRAGVEAVCLVQEKYATQARAVVEELARTRPWTAGRIRLVSGDITRSDLGLDAAPSLAEVREVYHLAAVYDLSAPRALALRVNVDGTRHVLDLAERCPGLERFHHVSTCFVSGRAAGVFGEEDLEEGQSFNNHYEETKYLAEVDVRARMRAGLPATVYRPAIVVGDSSTGATQKLDGLYFALQWLVRQPGRTAVMPVVGSLKSEVNVVPRDFVVESMAQLAGAPRSKGRTYQLADPAPLALGDMIAVVGRSMGKRIVRLPLTADLAKLALRSVPGVHRLLRIPAELVDYLVHPARYDTRNALADLEGSGITCPPFASYVDALVSFVRQHRGMGSAPMA
jgi:thioester reductase-like protein